MSKYSARKTEVDGITFDSQAEARRYRDLRLLEAAGRISNLRRQVVFPLLPAVKFQGATRTKPALRYVADFSYDELIDGQKVGIVEDCKGASGKSKGLLTPVFNIKRHLLKVMFGVEVRIS